MTTRQQPPAPLTDRLQSISSFLSFPLVASLLQLHPNLLALPSFTLPPQWHPWWYWLERDDCPVVPWRRLLEFYNTCCTPTSCSDSAYFEDIPSELRALLLESRRLALPRDISLSFSTDLIPTNKYHLGASPHTSLPGMSPKKAHEIVQMAGFIRTVLRFDSSAQVTRHAIDIGAGQAYLSRTLRDNLGLHVLALDWSDVQTQGAARKDASKAGRESRQKGKQRNEPCDPTDPLSHGQSEATVESSPSAGSLTYITARIDQDTLISSANDWLPRDSSTSQPTPVLFVALHACGSLTPDILRAFVAACHPASRAESAWVPSGAVIVGCCYNMLRPDDFPLSRVVRSITPVVLLSPNHLQLAAQVPSQWLQSSESMSAAQLALRKITWRAVLEEELSKSRNAEFTDTNSHPEHSTSETRGQESRPTRLGRLNDSAYTDWETFSDIVRTKLELPHLEVPRPEPLLEKRIEVFQTLRCILGPVVESFILLDRLAWVEEELSGLPFEVELVNLFDQASGSGRNVAIVIRPLDVVRE